MRTQVLSLVICATGLLALATSPMLPAQTVDGGSNEVGIVIGSGASARTGARLPGFWGLLAPVREDLAAELDAHLSAIVLEKIELALSGKGYRPEHILTTGREWKLMADGGKSRRVFDAIVARYDLAESLERFERIVVVEYLFEPRVSKASAIDELTLDTATPKYAKAKLWMFDTQTGEQLFSRVEQHGFSEVTKKTVEEALSKALDFTRLPESGSR